ncbi:ABC transporter permease [Nocardioides pakistanensis]
MAEERLTAASTSGAIHDIGYRHYDGPRLGTGYIQRSLYVDTLKGAFGLGRATRSKVMPILLLAVMTFPALVLAIVTSVTGADEIPGGYSGYLFDIQVVIAIFVGSQSPAVVSRDLRFGVVPLYFSRPLARAQYVQAKYAGLATALFILVALPLTVLFAGALLAELPLSEQLAPYLRSLIAAVLYAVVLAGIGLAIAAFTPRRGLGVAAIVAVLLVLSGVRAIVAGLGMEFDQEALAQYAGLISPFTLVDATVTLIGADSSVGSAGPPDGLGGLVFPVVLVLVVAGCYAALAARYRKVSGS